MILNIWLGISFLYLLYNMYILNHLRTPAKLFGSPIEASLIILLSLYVVLFFIIKSLTIVGYKEKSDALTQEIIQAQQYHDSIIEDALLSYEFNVTRNQMIHGFETVREELGDLVTNYSDLISFMTNKIIHSNDIRDFSRYSSPKNLLDSFSNGISKTELEYRRLTDTGEYMWVNSVTNLIKSVKDDNLIAYVCIRDIDNEKRRQLKLQQMAECDPLTGLYNKEITRKLINEHLKDLYDSNHSALFMIDIDNFKEINDHFGHLYGDIVLCELADKLRSILSTDNIIGRIGGDEYIVYIKNSPSFLIIKEYAQSIVKAFDITYKNLQGDEYAISSSVGIALFPKDGRTFEELYRYADEALYKAKNEGKHQYQLYDGSDFAGYSSDRQEQPLDSPLSPKSFRENRMEYIFQILYQSEDANEAIYSVLELVTRHFGFERGYIFETSEDGKTTSNTFEWCADDVQPQINNLQNVPMEAATNANEHFYKTGFYIMRTLDDSPPSERKVLESQNIKSMIQFGIFDKHSLIGFIGFDNCTNEILLGDEESEQIRTICNLLATFFVKNRMETILEKDLQVWKEMINKLNEFIYVVNPKTFEVLFMNAQTSSLMHQATTTLTCYDFFRGSTHQCDDCPIRKIVDTYSGQAIEDLYNERLNLWLETTASPIHWLDGTPAFLISCSDITQQKNDHIMHINQLEQLAFVDELTGIRTFYKFNIDAQNILECQQDTSHFLIKLDIDNFKLINQIYSYEKGDEILCCVAQALEKTAQNENEIFARVAADDFIALFILKDKDSLSTFHNSFINNFSNLMDPDFTFKCNFSYGVSIIRPEDEQAFNIKYQFEKANIAQKTAKLDKTLNYVIYDESMTKKALHTKEIENKMVGSLQKGEFVVYLQPKYYLDLEMIGGAEALTRWKTANVDLFFPDTFIPVFEKNGFITKLDFYVLHKVCNTIKGWIENGIEPVTVSVNFSKLHISNPDFVKELCEIVDAAHIDHKYIEIEITETVIYDNIDALEVLLDDLHKNGFTMSMDDFGTGYSSLGMLKNLPVDVIKMDRSFFVNQKDSNRSKIVVGSIINMASLLGIRIVAEGVEEQQHIDFLRELHCDMVQGYYYARPMPTSDFNNLMKNQLH
ncbi:MAG: EAL domain-containing protein [Lachnospiraceae bacterium]